MTNILILFFHTITFVGITILAHCTLTVRRSKLLIALIWIANYLFVFIGYIVLHRAGISNWLLYYLLSITSFGVYLYIFEASFAQDLFIFFMFWGFSSFLSTLSNWFAYWLDLGSFAIAAQCLFYLGCFACIIPLYRKYWARAIREVLTLFLKGKSIYAAFPLLSFIVYVALFGPLTETISIKWFALMILFECLILFMYYLLFSHFRLIYDHLRAEDRLENAEQQRALQKKYYEEVERGVQTQAKLLHDTRHHLLAVASLAQEEDSTAIKQYIEQLLAHFGSTHERRFCEHSVANAVIGGYIDIAERNGIAVSTEIDLPQAIWIDEYELCTLFGNTIENAIEACQRIPMTSAHYTGRYIDIRSSAADGRLIVRIENSYEGELVKGKNRFSSSKGALGGIGLESVGMVVDTYSGTMSCEAQDSVFVLSAILYPR